MNFQKGDKISCGNFRFAQEEYRGYYSLYRIDSEILEKAEISSAKLEGETFCVRNVKVNCRTCKDAVVDEVKACMVSNMRIEIAFSMADAEILGIEKTETKLLT